MEHKNGVEIMYLNGQNIVLISNSRTAWPTLILMLVFKFLRQFTIRCIYIIFQKGVDNFAIEHKIC